MFFCLFLSSWFLFLNFSSGLASMTQPGNFSQTCIAGETMDLRTTVVTGISLGCPWGYFANDNTGGCVECPYPFTNTKGTHVTCEGIQFSKGSETNALAVVMSFICFIIGVTMLRIKDSESLKISIASALVPAFDYATDVTALFTVPMSNLMYYRDNVGNYVCTGVSPYTMVVLFVIFIFVTPGIFFIKYLIQKRIESRVHSLFPFPLKKGEETEVETEETEAEIEPQKSINSYVHDICYVLWFLTLCLPMLPWLMYGSLLYQINLIPISVHWNFWVNGWTGTGKFLDVENKHHLDIDRLKLCQNSHVFTEALPMFVLQAWNTQITLNYLFPSLLVSIVMSGVIVLLAIGTYLYERFYRGRAHEEMSLDIYIPIPINIIFQKGCTFPKIEYLFYRSYNDLDIQESVTEDKNHDDAL